MTEPLHLISLGAGVQSSTMLLMADAGELSPRPAAAIFADTQGEPTNVYRYLAYLEGKSSIPITSVTAGSLEKAALTIRTAKDGRKWTKTAIPFFLRFDDGKPNGKIPQRKCTVEFKILPLVKEARRLVGKVAMLEWRRKHKDALKALSDYKKFERQHTKNSQPSPRYPLWAWNECQRDPLAIQWIGISLDEKERMKDSREPWLVTRWPLIEKRMTRGMCVDWLLSRGHPEPPKSACRYCPFRTPPEWREMQLNSPDDFAGAVKFQHDIQAVKAKCGDMVGVPFLTRNCELLELQDFRTDVELGQLVFSWGDECEGVCGV